MTVVILIIVAGVLYAGAFVASSAAKNETVRRNYPAWFALTALSTQFSALCVRFAESGSIFATSYDMLESFVFAFAASLLFCRFALRVRFLQFFTMLPVAILTLLPVFCPVFTSSIDGTANRAGGGELAAMHGILAAFSYAALGMASVFATMYLLQKRFLQKKISSKFASLMPSISALHKMLMSATTCAFVFMLVSLGFAVAAMRPQDLSDAEILKFSTGFLVFAVQGTLYFIVKRRTLPEGTIAIITLAATFLCALLLLPIGFKDFIL